MLQQVSLKKTVLSARRRSHRKRQRKAKARVEPETKLPKGKYIVPALRRRLGARQPKPKEHKKPPILGDFLWHRPNNSVCTSGPNGAEWRRTQKTFGLEHKLEVHGGILSRHHERIARRLYVHQVRIVDTLYRTFPKVPDYKTVMWFNKWWHRETHRPVYVRARWELLRGGNGSLYTSPPKGCLSERYSRYIYRTFFTKAFQIWKREALLKQHAEEILR